MTENDHAPGPTAAGIVLLAPAATILLIAVLPGVDPFDPHRENVI